MAWLNEEVGGLLREYAELTQITGGDVFRARNYEKAARSVRGWGENISRLDAKGLRASRGRFRPADGGVLGRTAGHRQRSHQDLHPYRGRPAG